MENNNLPKYWCVKQNQSNPDWQKVIKYLHKVYCFRWDGDTYNYYGYDGNSSFNGTNCRDEIKYFHNNPTLLTIEQFVEMTKEFIFPEKWCIQIHYDNSYILDKWRKNQPDYKNLGLSEFNGLLLSDKHDGSYTHWGSPESYTEITFEQFKKYVMKEKNEIPEYVECINNKGCEDYGIIGKDVKFKVGDWVYIIDGGSGATGANELVGQITDRTGKHGMLQSEKGVNIDTGKIIWKVNINAKLRQATEEEIQKAKYIPEGTACLVRDYDNDTWKLAYSNGNDTFKWTYTHVDSWKQVQVLDVNNLPKY